MKAHSQNHSQKDVTHTRTHVRCAQVQSLMQPHPFIKAVKHRQGEETGRALLSNVAECVLLNVRLNSVFGDGEIYSNHIINSRAPEPRLEEIWLSSHL